MPSQSPTGETLTLDYADGWAAVNRLIRQGLSWSGREMDCAYWNAGDGTFVDVSNTLGLAWKGDGRAFARVDWDGDGDEDLWLANRTAPQVQFLRNEIPTAGFLRLMLEGQGANTEAIGARVELRIADRLVVRERRLGSGYLSQSSSWLHFGLGDAQSIDSLRVRWPNGEWQSFTGLAAGGRYRLIQGTDAPVAVNVPARSIRLTPSKVQPAKPPVSSRVVITRRLALPKLEAKTFEGRALTTQGGRPRLVNFWSSTCANCIRELRAWKEEREVLADLDLDIIALSVDELPESAEQLWSRLELPFEAGAAPERWISLFDLLQRLTVDRQREMAVPTSFLLDANGDIAVIYRGPVDLDVIAGDVRALEEDTPPFAGLPFEGRNIGQAKPMPLFEIHQRLLDQGQPLDALFYIERACEELGPPQSRPVNADRISDALTRTGVYFTTQGDWEQARNSFDRAIAYMPTDALAWFGRARLCATQQDNSGAALALERAVELDASFAPAWDLLGTVRFLLQDLPGARAALQSATAVDPSLVKAWTTLGVVELTSEEFAAGAVAFEKATQLNPRSTDAWTGLGMCQVRNAQTEIGVKSLEKALELDPNNSRALGFLRQMGRR